MFLTRSGKQENRFAWWNSFIDRKYAPKCHVYIRDRFPQLSDRKFNDLVGSIRNYYLSFGLNHVVNQYAFGRLIDIISIACCLVKK